MRVIGLDYGSVTCGVALSDETLLIASPVETIRYKTMEELLIKLDVYFNEYIIDKIVLGNPINLDGSISTRSELTLLFKDDTALKNICKCLRADNFIYINGEIRQDIRELSKKEFEKIMILNRDGYLNTIPADSSEEEIMKYLKFLKGNKPRNI